MKRTKYIPSIVMLAAALVTCVTTIYFEYSTRDILMFVLAAGVVFLLIGFVIQFIAEKYLIVETTEEIIKDELTEADGEEGNESNQNES